MSFDYVRNYYGVPAKRGGRVKWTDSNGTEHYGTITSADNHVHVRDDGMKHSQAHHPEGLQYLDAPGGARDGE